MGQIPTEHSSILDTAVSESRHMCVSQQSSYQMLESVFSQTKSICDTEKACLESSVVINLIAIGNKMSKLNNSYILYFKIKYLFGKMYWDWAKYSDERRSEK